ncbi:MAG: SRPBCC domain-containing protein [Planctomycetota bacterium]
MSKNDRRFEMQIEIAASKDAVWDALTKPEVVSQWFAPEVRVDPKVGGEVCWSWSGEHEWPQTIEVFEPQARFVTTYPAGAPLEDGSRTPLLMDFRLEGEGGKTTLRLVHSGFGPDASFDAEYDGISRGWPVELESLRLYLEQHAGEQRRVTWVTHDIEGTLESAWERIAAKDALGCGAAAASLKKGEAFDFTMATGERFHGRALKCGPHEFSGVAESHGNAFLRLCTENCGGTKKAWLWLATYGQPNGDSERREAEWQSLLEKTFPAAASMEPKA